MELRNAQFAFAGLLLLQSLMIPRINKRSHTTFSIILTALSSLLLDERLALQAFHSQLITFIGYWGCVPITGFDYDMITTNVLRHSILLYTSSRIRNSNNLATRGYPIYFVTTWIVFGWLPYMRKNKKPMYVYLYGDVAIIAGLYGIITRFF